MVTSLTPSNGLVSLASLDGPLVEPSVRLPELDGLTRGSPGFWGMHISPLPAGWFHLYSLTATFQVSKVV